MRAFKTLNRWLFVVISFPKGSIKKQELSVITNWIVSLEEKTSTSDAAGFCFEPFLILENSEKILLIVL